MAREWRSGFVCHKLGWLLGYFFFCPSSKGRGWGGGGGFREGRGNFSRIRGKRGKRGGGGVDAGKGSGGIFWGGGVLNIYFEGRGATLVKVGVCMPHSLWKSLCSAEAQGISMPHEPSFYGILWEAHPLSEWPSNTAAVDLRNFPSLVTRSKYPFVRCFLMVPPRGYLFLSAFLWWLRLKMWTFWCVLVWIALFVKQDLLRRLTLNDAIWR